MSQHDFNIGNQLFPATRTDLNNALVALASNSSGTSAPSTTYANQWWYETDTNKLQIRNEANSAWIEIATLDQSGNSVQSITTAGLTLGSTAISATGVEINQLDAITRGSILYGNASGATARLAKGSAAQVLTSNGTDISWSDVPYPTPPSVGLQYASAQGPSSNETLGDNAGTFASTFAWNAISTYGFNVAQTSVFSTSEKKLVFHRLSTGSGITGNSLSGTGYIAKALTVYKGIPSGTNVQEMRSGDWSRIESIATSLTSFNTQIRDKTEWPNTSSAAGYFFPVVLEPNEVLWVLFSPYNSGNRQGSATINTNNVTLETWS